MAEFTWPAVLSRLLGASDLSTEASTWAMEQILGGDATPSQIGGFLVALRSKGETVDEITAFVETMYRHAAPMEVEGRVVDIVGTGGDGARTVNISTMAAVTIAGAGTRATRFSQRRELHALRAQPPDRRSVQRPRDACGLRVPR